MYAITGQLVATLLDAQQTAGYHAAQFDGTGFGTGVYLYRLRTDTFTQTRKMVHVR